MATIQVTPHGIEHLAFSYALPSDWNIGEVPAEEPNFDDPKYFLPLAAAVSPDGSGAFTAGARPGYADGALSDWLTYLCSQDNIEIEAIRPFSHGEMRGLRFDARQSDGETTMCMCNVYVEDGGRLFAICTMAIEPLFPPIAPILSAIAESFRIDAVNGPTVPLSN
jgi:hypothetical protein